MECPDRLGYVLGARAWRIRRFTTYWQREPEDDRIGLWSVARQFLWPQRQAAEASCDARSRWIIDQGNARRHGPAPDAGCRCGLWALADPEQVLFQWPQLRVEGHAFIYGTVALWGAVVLGTEGWRGQYAYPQALVARLLPPSVPEQVLSDIASAYGIPILDDWPRLDAPEAT